MARIRSIHPPIFTDEGFVSLSMAARVLLMGIWTEADDHGVFEWKPVTLKMRVMPVDNVSIPELLAECEAADVVKRFTDGKSYGLVRNFCRYQRPKKPKYVHPIPSELYLYAGLKADGTLPVLHQSRTGGETSPQREEEGGMMEDEKEIEKEEGEKAAPSKLKLVSEEKAIPIDLGYGPSDRAVEYAYSLGMKKPELTSELSKFIAKAMTVRKVSFNPDMDFKLWCDRWLEFKLQKNPNWKPEPPPRPEIDRSGWPIVVEGTQEHTCWNIVRREMGEMPLFLCKQVGKDGTIYERGARCPTLFPPGFNDFGERIPPSAEDAA